MMIEVYDKTKEELLSDPMQADFVRQYIAAREKELRLYTHKEILQLPGLPVSHVFYNEWQIRKRSADNIVKYLGKWNRPLKILEVGCGNGWLSAAIAKVKNSEVTGIDINALELNQAKEVFHDLDNVNFICTTINSDILKPHSFDIIVFAAAIQYFDSVEQVINAALSLLSAKGEIHIIDTHFYKAHEVESAKKRTNEYYTALGFPAMNKYYHHHVINDFLPFQFSILFTPSFLKQKLMINPHPFYWIKINGKN